MKKPIPKVHADAHGRRIPAPKPRFRAAVKPYRALGLTEQTLELQIYEDIGPGYWGEPGLTAKTVKQAIDAAGSFNRIAVRINSPGGDAFEGVAIMNLVRAQRKPVDVFVDGIAASAASIIAMAGDTITMGQSAMMMVHNAWTFAMGDADDLRKTAETLDVISASIGDAYVKRTGKTAAEIKTIMDAETWMGAQECVDQGFATGIDEAEPDDDEAMALARSFKSLAKLKNVPEKLRSAAVHAEVGCTCTCGACVDGNCADCACTGCNAEDCTASDCNCGNSVQDDDGDTMDSNLSQYEARLKLIRA
jgi:ATP-dependent Clp protease, protease subunit